MKTTSSFNRGAAAGALLIIGAQAVHWFIDPASSSGASGGRTAAVAIQAIACIGLAVWLRIRERRTAPTT